MWETNRNNKHLCEQFRNIRCLAKATQRGHFDLSNGFSPCACGGTEWAIGGVAPPQGCEASRISDASGASRAEKVFLWLARTMAGSVAGSPGWILGLRYFGIRGELSMEGFDVGELFLC